MSYDAWGRFRDPKTQKVYSFDTEIYLVLGWRGYTGHEHLPMFGLINMNARLYDPVVGRFLSPDPYVQAPDFSQNFNRYLYALNNPLRYTDPNGESWITLAGASGIPMSNTLGMMTASSANSLGMGIITGGDIPFSINFGFRSYDFSNGDFGFLDKKGNSFLENLGYLIGATANSSDIVSLLSGGGANPNLIVEKEDNIRHSAIVDEPNNINISVGPNRDLGEGINMEALKSGKGTINELRRNMKGVVWENHISDGHGWKLRLTNISKNNLLNLSNEIQT